MLLAMKLSAGTVAKDAFDWCSQMSTSFQDLKRLCPA